MSTLAVPPIIAATTPDSTGVVARAMHIARTVAGPAAAGVDRDLVEQAAVDVVAHADAEHAGVLRPRADDARQLRAALLLGQPVAQEHHVERALVVRVGVAICSVSCTFYRRLYMIGRDLIW